ncbi:hypothetical protein BD309DRAFT_855041 [Dichomitus squalens]|uniref:DUF7137 domain-containing protein n=2 Tax=Dichomitus squalens TaxID=114155 RepID=A0A4Q9PPZ2_9APHY|nr:uncharacterized protein DICSQDRAFT_138871 [Dichomitus squalens LYAD-421 SS1]EJF58980.1 hypothetical protein DICSQDRAFT_138871 [Dichomitus squalens LYAD-421 SS1]TBU24115.1 hypothetical protein BD311DRAFT_702714 [Dichomitus squalens]TBU47823.1 hypothetical protein BD309DRAFT_855041 [Dichomitus squalens]TBU56421.1 hypothetical protein BD310DRAFT_823665 [Dichomitus squalens]
MAQNQQTPSPSNSGQQQNSPSPSSSSGIPVSAPAGGLTITKPPQTATSFFKIAPSNTVTFAWNFTDVLSTPTHLTVSAIGDNGNTYPVGPTDGVIPGTATEVTWDLWSYQQAHSNLPLAPGSYVLHIWDDRGPGAAREPGLLQENSALKFALYTPQPYTPLESWVCATCSGAWSEYTTHPAFVSLMVTVVVMFLSGYSLIRQALH